MPSHKRDAVDTNDSQPAKKPRRATFRVANKPKNLHVSATTLRTHSSGHIGRRQPQVKAKQVDGKESEEVGDDAEGGSHNVQASSLSETAGTTNTLLAAQASPTSPDDAVTASTKPKRKKCVNTTSVSSCRPSLLPYLTAAQSRLTEWLQYRNGSLDELLRLYGRGDYHGIDTCATCKNNEGVYRCLDCFGNCQLHCNGCLVKKHQDLPLHRVEVCSFLSIELS